MITTINEFRKIYEYNDAAIRAYYDKLLQDGSPEQEALLSTANWFKLTRDYTHDAIKRASQMHENKS